VTDLKQVSGEGERGWERREAGGSVAKERGGRTLKTGESPIITEGGWVGGRKTRSEIGSER
jgi:hypothetical protein